MANQVAPTSRPLVLLVEYTFLVAATVGRCSEGESGKDREKLLLGRAECLRVVRDPCARQKERTCFLHTGSAELIRQN